MRVVHVTLDGNLPRYGIGTAVLRLAEALARRGHDVVLAARRAGLAACPEVPGVRLAPLDHRSGPFGGRPDYLRQLRRAAAPGADAIHVHALSRVAAWLLPARRRGGARLVVTAHSHGEVVPAEDVASGGLARRARRHAAQAREVVARADAVVAPSRFVARAVERFHGRRPHVVPWGPSDETPADRAPHEGFAVLALGRLVPEKGVHVLLEAFARALGGDGGARLVVAGDGPERGALAARAEALGLRGKVAFVGHVDGGERRSLLARTDVLAVPTMGDHETFCLAALDGSAAGAALLVADGGALPERAEGCGIVAPAGDVGAFAAALRALRDDPARTAALGEAGRRRAASFTWDAAARAYESLYAGTAPRDA